MANGFRALRHVGGGNQRYVEYPIKTAYVTQIFNGDVVEIATDQGYVNRAAATAGVQPVGIFVGCMYKNAKGEQKFSPDWTGEANATDIRALVSGDKGTSYKVQADAVTAASVGLACDLVATAGDIPTGLSRETVAVGAGAFVIQTILDDVNNIVEVVSTKGLGDA